MNIADTINDLLATDAELNRVRNLGTCGKSTIDIAQSQADYAQEDFIRMIDDIIDTHETRKKEK